MPDGRIAVLGLVGNHGEVETKDYVRRRLDEAPAGGQLALCPRCGFAAAHDEETAWGKLSLIQGGRGRGVAVGVPPRARQRMALPRTTARAEMGLEIMAGRRAPR